MSTNLENNLMCHPVLWITEKRIRIPEKNLNAKRHSRGQVGLDWGMVNWVERIRCRQTSGSFSHLNSFQRVKSRKRAGHWGWGWLCWIGVLEIPFDFPPTFPTKRADRWAVGSLAHRSVANGYWITFTTAATDARHKFRGLARKP